MYIVQYKKGGETMNIQTGLFQQQTLKLNMTKELTQAIALLQYSSMELVDFLQEQVMENPLIEITVKDVPSIPSQRKKPKKRENEKSWIENVSASKKTLHEHLYDQLSLTKLTEKEKKIARYLIDQLDHNGYLTSPLEEVAKRFSISIQHADQILKIIQTFDPAGIGARSLQECLLLQLERLESCPHLAKLIIEHHFQCFAKKQWKEIAKSLDVQLSDIQEIHDFIQTLQPRPGLAYSAEEPMYIVPDLAVENVNGEWIIRVIDDYMPALSLNETYIQELSMVNDKEIKSFLQDKMYQYRWLMKSLEQRKQTLLNVMKEIFFRQQGYFQHGPAHLKPLTMKEIAEALNIHESTVSRAVKDKFVQTPFGIVEMKSFFTTGLQTDGDEETSAAKVKQLIQMLVDQEDKTKPLSDQKIVDMLKKEHGMVVSRRTIAKYRDQLGIPSSSKRKRYE
jgi:RNA polymerase sigma-54 factor